MPGAPPRLWDWQYASSSAMPFEDEPVGFRNIPRWDVDDHGAALECFLKSASHSTLPGLVRLESAAVNALSARTFFETHFAAFRVIAEAGLLTSYFEPVLQGSRTQSSKFHVPVYKRPNDLLQLSEGDLLRSEGFTAARDGSGGLTPYFTRGEIEAGALAHLGLEALYLDDPVTAFIMHVQGSGAVRLEDGSVIRLSFDGKNGHPYTSIGKLLVTRGEIDAGNASLDQVIAWLRVSGHRARALMAENKSYIFFRELAPEALGPVGSMGVPLTPGRSLAVDARIHRLGTPVFVSAPALQYESCPFQRLMIAQDTGSAIVGAQRGDVFAGSGRQAERFAGNVRHGCEFFMLKPL